MKLWLIVLQSDDLTWIEDAWDDYSTAENHTGWKATVDKARRLALTNGYEIRVLSATVKGIYEAFNVPELLGAVDGA